MNSNQIMKIICLLVLQLQFSSSLTIPTSFNDSHLSTFIIDKGLQLEHLGPIIKLDTYFAPSDFRMISAKFNIYSRAHSLEDIPFKPNNVYCSADPSEYGASACIDPSKYHQLSEIKFNSNLKTIIMVPGYRTGDRIKSMERAKDVWLKIENVNIIIVTWSEANMSLLYGNAVANTPIIARQITVFLHYLANLSGFRLMENDQFLKNIHVIGHSLGAHIGGFVGQDLAGKMGRITGLDPAGPSFDQMDRSQRLDKTDAKLVDIIHTNCGKIHYPNLVASVAAKVVNEVASNVPIVGKPIEETIKNIDHANEENKTCFGIDDDLGHIDYYANNGRNQPGCDDLIHKCDHMRANQIILDILNYELKLRSAMKDGAHLKEHRLVAYRAENFQDFNSGSFLKNCPESLNSMQFLFSQNKGIKDCSAPIDLLSSVDELVQELPQNQPTSFKDGQMRRPNRFYFKTLKESPFMGDHYMLKVKIDEGSSLLDGRCSLRIQVKMSDGYINSLEINGDSIEPVIVPGYEGSQSTALMVPFINPYSARSVEYFDDTLAIMGHSTDPIRFDDPANKVWPSYIEIGIVSAEQTGFLSSAYSKIKNFFSFKQATVADNCQLSIVSVEVQPLITHSDKSIIGVYCSPENSSNSDCSGDNLHSGGYYKESLDTPMPDNFINSRSTLFGTGNPTVALYKLSQTKTEVRRATQ